MSEFIPRALEKVIGGATPPNAVVVIGPRRCGKTTFLRHFVKTLGQETRWLNCDLPADVNQLHFVSQGDVETFLRQAPIIVIDEAQRVPDIGLVIKTLVDINELRDQPSRIFITGSSSLELANGVKESAVGRVKERRMWPLAMQEIANHRSWGYVHENLSNFLVYGTYPAVVKDFESAWDVLNDYVDGILFKDLFQMAEIRRNNKFVDLVTALCYRIGSEINYESLGRDLDLSKLTVQRYINLLELCSIVKVVPSYSKNLDNELKKGKKVYFTDVGVRNALIGDFSPFSTRADAGALWENFFYMERVKMHDTLRDRKKMYFWRTKGYQPKELDFVEVVNQRMEGFECKLSDRASANVGVDFKKSYPACQIHVVTPNNCLPFFGMDDC